MYLYALHAQNFFDVYTHTRADMSSDCCGLLVVPLTLMRSSVTRFAIEVFTTISFPILQLRFKGSICIVELNKQRLNLILEGRRSGYLLLRVKN